MIGIKGGMEVREIWALWFEAWSREYVMGAYEMEYTPTTNYLALWFLWLIFLRTL